MLGTMPMGKLVVKISVPIMISMMVQALYNVVDGIFVARYSAEALTASSLPPRPSSDAASPESCPSSPLASA